ncbi:MAG: PAS domain-containing protein, partial [Thermomicrobiales bacterium]
DFTVLSFNGEYDTSVRHAPGSRPLAVGRSLLDAMPAASHDAATRLLSRARDEGATIRSTAYAAAVVPDKFYDGTIQPLQLSDGTPALVITAVNVTERVRNEREREELLRQVERQAAQLAATFEAMVDGIAVYDAAGTVVHRNEAFYRLLRLAPGAAPPLWDDFIREMHLRRADGTPMTRAETHSFRALNGETIREEVVLVRDGAGRDRSMRQNASPIRATDGTVIGAVVVFNDVTERLEEERERERLRTLAEERRRFTQAIFDTVPVALAVIDTDAMTFSAANPTFVAGTPAPYHDVGVNDRPVARVLPHTVKNGFVDQLRVTGQSGAPSETLATRYEHPTRGTTYWDETMIPLAMRDQAARYVLYIAADVTDQVAARRRIVALAREAAERAAALEAIIANMPVGIAVHAADGHILQMNAVGREVTGGEIAPDASSSEIVEHFQMRYLDGRRIPEDDLPLVRALRGETVSEYEFMSHTRQGDAYFLTGSAPIRDAAGEITSAVVMFTDITERKRAERERERLLREVEEQRRFARTVIDSAPAGIAVCTADPGFTVLLANDRFRSIVGDAWAEPTLDGAPFHAFTPNAEGAGILPIFRRVAESGEPVTLSEFEYGGSGGEPSYFDWSLVPLREGGNQVTSLILLVTDVTDRVLSRQRIEELAWDAAQRASELETVIASIADGVIVSNAEGRIILENDASRRLMGRTASAVSFDLGAQDAARQLRDPDGTPIPPEELPLGRAVRGEIVTEQVLIVRRADSGEDRYLMCSSAPVRAGSSGAITGAVAVFRDITEMKQLDQMKDEFISIAAHELRTPLTAIKGYAELLDRRLSAQKGREADRRSLGIIRKQTERLAGLVNEMLDVSRIEAGRLQLNRETIDLSALTGDVVNSMRVSSEAHHLSFAAESGVAVSGDTARIEQVLINLIANAITYSPEGSAVDVRVGTHDGAALVSIRDHGVGIAPDELPHLFDRFYRAPRAGVMRSGGMGLGLYICREIVTQHGGTIEAESIEGAGSTFTFSLPLAEKDEGQRTKD